MPIHPGTKEFLGIEACRSKSATRKSTTRVLFTLGCMCDKLLDCETYVREPWNPASRTYALGRHMRRAHGRRRISIDQ